MPHTPLTAPRTLPTEPELRSRPFATPAAPPPPAGSATSSLDPWWYALSSAADHGMLWLALGSMRAARRGEPAIALRLGAVLGIESAITNGVVKSIFRRLRPDREEASDDGPLPFGMHRPITSSFPSGHATSAFTAAMVLTRRRRDVPAYFGLAALVAASRVRVRMHHRSDVLAGAALGLALGALARRLLPLEPGD